MESDRAATTGRLGVGVLGSLLGQGAAECVPLSLLPSLHACPIHTLAGAEPQYLHPNLHRSSIPLCLHAYALSSAGASHALSLLLNPWTAYQTAVDTAFPSFISFKLLNSFSVDPPLIIQRKDGPSDIQQGVGSKWRGLLMDSTVERIRRARGLEVWEDMYDENNLDPATVFRCVRARAAFDSLALYQRA